MFARGVYIRLKPNSIAEFNGILENEVLPLLRKQKGFRDELALVAPNGSEVVAISLWDQKENADAYGREAYPEVLKTLGKVVDELLKFTPTRLPVRPSTRSPLRPLSEAGTVVGGRPTPPSVLVQHG
jgi:hypothetical protein